MNKKTLVAVIIVCFSVITLAISNTYLNRYSLHGSRPMIYRIDKITGKTWRVYPNHMAEIQVVEHAQNQPTTTQR